MKLKERADQYAKLARRHLRQTARDDERFESILAFWRNPDADPVCIITPTEDDSRDATLRGAMIGAQGFGADVIMFVSDSFKVTVMTNPATGQDWDQGEMAEVFASGRYPGVVREALLITLVNRAGDILVAQDDYERTGHQIKWQGKAPDWSDVSGMEVRGVLADGLVEIMKQPDLMQRMARDRSDLYRAVRAYSMDRARNLMDKACATTLAEAGFAVLLRTTIG